MIGSLSKLSMKTLAVSSLCYGSYSLGKRGGLPTFKEMKSDALDAKKAYNSETGVMVRKGVKIGAIGAIAIPTSLVYGVLSVGVVGPNPIGVACGIFSTSVGLALGADIANDIYKS